MPGTCVYDDTLQDDCATPIFGAGAYTVVGVPFSPTTPSTLTSNSDPFSLPGQGGFAPSSDASSFLSSLNTLPSGAANPVSAMASSSNGNTALSTSILNFFTAVTPAAIKAASGSTTPTGLVLQTNPTTGQMQYYNPATGQYTGGAVNTGGLSGFFSGSGLYIILALVVAFFAFGGMKRLSKA